MTCGCPHITPLRRRGLGGELGSAYDRCAGALCCCVADVVLDPCGGGQMVRSDVSLAAGYWCLGVWVVGRRICEDWSGETAGE